MIARRYARAGLKVDPLKDHDHQRLAAGLDLLDKTFLNKVEGIIVERPPTWEPSNLSLFEPRFLSVPLQEDGLDWEALEETLSRNDAKLLYSLPNFQNSLGFAGAEEPHSEYEDNSDNSWR